MQWIRSYGLAVAVFLLLTLALASELASEKGKQISLHLLYEYRQTPTWKGRMLAVLDPESQFLYVIERQKAVVREIDWRASKQVRAKDFSHLSCDRKNPHLWEKYKDAPRLHRWKLIPGTPWVHMIYCQSVYLVDINTLEVVRKLIDGAVEWGSAFFLPGGDKVLITRSAPTENIWHRQLYRIDSWELLREWDDFAYFDVKFSPDGRYGYFMSAVEGATGKMACGLSTYELLTGRLEKTWELKGDSAHCPWPFEFLGQSQDIVVDLAAGPRVVVSLRDIHTGKVLRTIRLEGNSPKSRSISPDGRYVVAGAWDSPEDSPVSQDFKIWDIQTGEVVYETPKYLSVWGSRTIGREVRPRFSDDGKYLILVKERSVELHRILLPAARHEAKE